MSGKPNAAARRAARRRRERRDPLADPRTGDLYRDPAGRYSVVQTKPAWPEALVREDGAAYYWSQGVTLADAVAARGLVLIERAENGPPNALRKYGPGRDYAGHAGDAADARSGVRNPFRDPRPGDVWRSPGGYSLVLDVLPAGGRLGPDVRLLVPFGVERGSGLTGLKWFTIDGVTLVQRAENGDYPYRDPGAWLTAQAVDRLAAYRAAERHLASVVIGEALRAAGGGPE